MATGSWVKKWVPSWLSEGVFAEWLAQSELPDGARVGHYIIRIVLVTELG